MKRKAKQIVWDSIINIFLFILLLIVLLPFLNIIAKSFSPLQPIISNQVLFWPVDFTLTNYKEIMSDLTFLHSFGVSVFITLLGTLINMVFTVSLAYPLTRAEFMYKKQITIGIMFTFIFSVPLIPIFLWVRALGMYNTLWALMIPSAIIPFYFFILVSFFRQFIPQEIVDSARIDGSGELNTLIRIILPITKPALATIALFYAIDHWNAYFGAIIYIKDNNIMPLQVKLIRRVIETEMGIESVTQELSPEGLKMASIIVSMLPILCFYPYLQKYFVKGLTVGSIKG